jgi:hypothetical protein
MRRIKKKRRRSQETKTMLGEDRAIMETLLKKWKISEPYSMLYNSKNKKGDKVIIRYTN